MDEFEFLSKISRWPKAAKPCAVNDQIAAQLSKGNLDLENLLIGVLGNSSYLSKLIDRYPRQIEILVEIGPGRAMQAIIAQLPDLQKYSRAEFCKRVRQAKEKFHLCLALADLGGVCNTKSLIAEFSNFAEQMIQQCLEYSWNSVLSRYQKQKSSKLSEDMLRSSGLFVVAFGKLGGRELNYSSDVDLAIFWKKPVKTDIALLLDERKIIRIARDFVSLLSEVTEHGYVFRVDLRLRPDPSSTPIVLTTDAALAYYESVGQTWERAAWIKARIIAGDQSAGGDFLHQLTPFIWRKNLDFAAIDDVHQIRQQIFFGPNQPKAPDAGFNVKLGVGGIREIELFAQTLQLIHGGRLDALRCKNTIEALKALSLEGLITDAVAQELTQHYFFLRRLEHVLQMREDLQTHEIPKSQSAQQQVQNLLSYNSAKQFNQDLHDCAEQVARRTHELFGDSASASTLDVLHLFELESHPDAICLLQDAGFREARRVLDRLRGWMGGRARATQSLRSRRLLAKLAPDLIAAFSQSEEPDAAFLSFANFFEALPSGVQILSLFANSPGLLIRLLDIFQLAPRLSSMLTARPNLIEALLSKDSSYRSKTSDIWLDLRSDIIGSKDMELAMNMARRRVQEALFVIGSQLLSAEVKPDEIAKRCTHLAENTIDALAQQVSNELEVKTGQRSAHWAVLALGKLGSKEMTPASDLDLMVIYLPSSTTKTEKPALAGDVWAARFTRRLISALSAPTSEGLLYEVDMQLRPSGRSGPISVELSAFSKYYQKNAWIWEFQALTRSRVVSASSENFLQKVETGISQILTQYIDSKQVRPQINAMCQKLAKEKPALGLWDLKHGSGGLIELEFALQAMALLSAKGARCISLFEPLAAELNLIKPLLLNDIQFCQLKEAHLLFHGVLQVTAMAIGRIGTASDIPPSLLNVLLSNAHMSSLQDMEQEILLRRKQIAEILSHIISS